MKTEIPIKPISVNKCFQGHRYKTNEYANWRQAVYYLTLHVNPINNPTKLDIEFHVSNFGQSDVDNMLKPLLDALQECEIIENDNTIEEIHTKKIKCKKGEEKIIYELS